MSIGMLWYVLAGFVLGFTVSTLWEWLYYRNQRLRWRVERARHVGTNRQEQATNGATRKDDASERLPWEAPVYRSSGVFLESEKVAPAPYEPASERFAPTSPAIQPASAQPSNQPVTPRSRQATEPENNVPVDVVHQAVVELAPPITPSGFTADANSSAPVATSPDPAAPLVEGQTASIPQNTVIAPAQVTPDPVTRSDASSPVASASESPDNPTPPRSLGYPDDLTKIQGIGPAYKQRLYAAGIYTWQQVANSELAILRSITKAKPNARPEEWKTRAQALTTQFNRQAATYTGPVPDDLTKVNGIGPTYADALYRAGICTYEQLAAVAPAELAAILPTPAIGTEFNFADWIKQAAQFAHSKQRNASLFS